MMRKISPGVAFAVVLGSILAFSMPAAAQEVRSEFNISGTAFVSSSKTSGGLRYDPTDSGGFLVGYRHNLNEWAGFDVNYGWARNTQKFLTTGGTPFGPVGTEFSGARFSIHQPSVDFVAHTPTFWGMRPYVLAGFAALIFNPVDRNVAGLAFTPFTPAPGVSARIPTRWEPAFVYGGGADISLVTRSVGTPGVAIRVGYRGYVHEVPDFGFQPLDMDATTHVAMPEVGLVLRF
jgi:opacity protein-like surface antigen